jgi:hypothetical protein
MEGNDMRGVKRVRLKMLVPLALLAIVSVPHGFAQAIEGALEVGLEGGGSLFLASGGRGTIGGFILFGEPHADYYLSERVSIGATAFILRSFDDEPDQLSLKFGGAYGQVQYHFNPRRQFSSYLGARIGVFMPNSEPFLSFGGQFGMKYFAARQFSINGQLTLTVSPVGQGILLLTCLGVGVSYYIQ